MDAADGLGQDHADVHRFDLGTLELLELVGDGVGHHHLATAEGGARRAFVILRMDNSHALYNTRAPITMQM